MQISAIERKFSWGSSPQKLSWKNHVNFFGGQGVSFFEVADILGIPVGMGKSRMSNALKKLKETVDERGS